MYWPRNRSASIWETNRCASILRENDRLRCRPVSSRQRTSQVTLPSRSRFSTLATSGRRFHEPSPDPIRVEPHVPAELERRWPLLADPPLIQGADGHAEELRHVLEGPQPLTRRLGNPDSRRLWPSCPNSAHLASPHAVSCLRSLPCCLFLLCPPLVVL